MPSYVKCQYGHIFHIKKGIPESNSGIVHLICPKCSTDRLGVIPKPVVEAIAKKFEGSKLVEGIMDSLKYDSLLNCYYFVYANMYHGVETDGYIHT